MFTLEEKTRKVREVEIENIFIKLLYGYSNSQCLSSCKKEKPSWYGHIQPLPIFFHA